MPFSAFWCFTVRLNRKLIFRKGVLFEICVDHTPECGANCVPSLRPQTAIYTAKQTATDVIAVSLAVLDAVRGLCLDFELDHDSDRDRYRNHEPRPTSRIDITVSFAVLVAVRGLCRHFLLYETDYNRERNTNINIDTIDKKSRTQKKTAKFLF